MAITTDGRASIKRQAWDVLVAVSVAVVVVVAVGFMLLAGAGAGADAWSKAFNFWGASSVAIGGFAALKTQLAIEKVELAGEAVEPAEEGVEPAPSSLLDKDTSSRSAYAEGFRWPVMSVWFVAMGGVLVAVSALFSFVVPSVS